MKENILGIDVCPFSMEETLHEAEKIIVNKEKGFIVAINPEKIMKGQKDLELKKLLNSANIQIPDGVGVVIASKLKRGRIKKRVTGIDLMMNLCDLASKKGYKIYMLGAAPNIAESAMGELKKKFPSLIVSGVNDGYFKDNEKQVIDNIYNSNSDILFVALGSPRQEYWIKQNIDNLNVPLIMGVGGSFDVICGNIKRAPAWMRKCGLEWLYRLISEPWRFKRMMVLPKFLIKALLS